MFCFLYFGEKAVSGEDSLAQGQKTRTQGLLGCDLSLFSILAPGRSTDGEDGHGQSETERRRGGLLFQGPGGDRFELSVVVFC